MESTSINSKGESSSADTVNEMVGHDAIEEVRRQTTISDDVRTVNFVQGFNEVDQNPKAFGPDALHAAMTAVNITEGHLKSVQDRAGNLISRGPRAQQEAEVYTTLVAVRKLIYDHHLDNSLLRVLGQPVSTCNDVDVESGIHDQTLKSTTGQDLSKLPDEIIVKIVRHLFHINEEDKRGDPNQDDITIAKGIHFYRSKHHAILRTCHHLRDVATEYYRQNTAMFIEPWERRSSDPINWAGKTFLIPYMIVNTVYDARNMYYVLDRFPKLEHLSLDLLTNMDVTEEDPYPHPLRIESGVSWSTLKSNPMDVFTSSYLVCIFCEDMRDICEEFTSALEVCRQLRSKIPKVELKFHMQCTDVRCLTHRGVTHQFQADYVLHLHESESLRIIDGPYWDIDERMGCDIKRPECDCKTKFLDSGQREAE